MADYLESVKLSKRQLRKMLKSTAEDFVISQKRIKELNEELAALRGEPSSFCQCDDCGRNLTEVRPGKYQCDYCELQNDNDSMRNVVDAALRFARTAAFPDFVVLSEAVDEYVGNSNLDDTAERAGEIWDAVGQERMHTAEAVEEEVKEMKTNDALLPCDCNNSDPKIVKSMKWADSVHIECMGCGRGTGYNATDQQAFDEWNCIMAAIRGTPRSKPLPRQTRRSYSWVAAYTTLKEIQDAANKTASVHDQVSIHTVRNLVLAMADLGYCQIEKAAEAAGEE